MAFAFLDSRDIVAGFYPQYEQAVAGNYANALCMPFDSTREIETYSWLGQSSSMREWVGGRNEQSLSRFTQLVRNRKFENTLVIPREDLRRDKTSQLRLRVADLANKAADHPNQLLAALINSNPTAYDGVAFYATTHAESGSNQSNAITNSNVAALDVATPASPTADEFANILVGVAGYMYSIVDDKGDPMNGGAKNFHVLCSTAAQWSAAQRAVSLNNLTSGASNPVVGLQSQGINFSVTFDPRLTTLASATQFVVSITDSVMKPFIDQVEEPLYTQLLGEGSEEAFKNDRHLFGVQSTRAIAPGFWQKSVRCTLS